MTKSILLTLCILSITGLAHSDEGGPRRAPGMNDGPRIQKIDLNEIRFEYDSKNELFKSAEEAKEYQSLFEKFKTSKEITDHIEKVSIDKKSKMDEMRKSGKPPEFSKMKEERTAEEFILLKDIKVILEKKKKDNMASLALSEEVKCSGGKSLPVIEKATTDSMKDTSKVAKIILTEDELARMKSEIKEEVKKEMMKEMAKNKPHDEPRDEGDRPRFDRSEKRRENDDEDRPKMAEGKNRKQMPRAGGSESASMFASQMSGQMGGMNMFQMGNSQMGMMGNSQMNMNQGYSRDQMIQNQIRVPQNNFNQNYAGSGYPGPRAQSPMAGQMRRPQMQMNQNQNFGYSYQSNPGQNYNGQSQYGYNFMAPKMDYGYTGNNSMMPANQQSIPSYSQYSFMGY